MTRYRWAAAVLLALGGCAELPEAPATAAAPDYPTTVPGLVTVAPLRHDSDVALIAPDIEHVIWASTTLQAAQVSAPARAVAPAPGQVVLFRLRAGQVGQNVNQPVR